MNMEKDNILIHTAVRKGKVFEFVYCIDKNYKPSESIIKLIEVNNNNSFRKEIKLESKKTRNSKSNINNINIITNENIQYSIKNEIFMNDWKEKSEDNVSKLNIDLDDGIINNYNKINDNNGCLGNIKVKSEVINNTIEIKKVIEANESNVSIINTAPKNIDITKKSQNYKQEDKTKFQFNQFSYIPLNSDDFYFICNKIYTDNHYLTIQDKYRNIIVTNSNINNEEIKGSPQLNLPQSSLDNIEETIRREIILDFFYSNFDKMGTKSFSNVSYNRYIYCLNEINKHCIFSTIELKNKILNELEKDIDYIIDRRTLKNILINLEKIGLIKKIDYLLTMKNMDHQYSKNRDEINQYKMIVLRRDIDENDNRIIKHCDVNLKPKYKKSKKEDVEDDDKDHTNDIDFSFNTITGNTINKSFSGDLVINNMKDVKDIMNNFDLKVSLSSVNIEKASNIIQRIITLNKSYKSIICLNEKRDSFNSLKHYVFVKKNLKFLIDDKKFEKEYCSDKIPLFKLFDNQISHIKSKILIPIFMYDKLLKRNKEKDENKIKSMLVNANVNINVNANAIDCIKVDTNMNMEVDVDVNDVGNVSLLNNTTVIENNISNYKLSDIINNGVKINYQHNDNDNTYNLNSANDIDNAIQKIVSETVLNERDFEFSKKYLYSNRSNNTITNNSIINNKINTNKKSNEIKPIKLNEFLYDNDDEITIFLKKKRKKSISTKLIDLYSVLEKIYFNPNINFKRLQKLVPSYDDYSDFLIYFRKYGLLQIKCLDNKNITEDKILFELDKSIHSFFEIV